MKIDALHPTEADLTGAGSQPLQVCGKFEANLQYEARSSKQTVYVVSALSKALLGKPAIESLNLVTRVDSVDKGSCKASYTQNCSQAWGLGSLKGEYTIKLKPNSTPFALTTPRRVALPLRPRVKEELERMENMGVITKISEPTEWCVGIVVVPKPNGKIQICVDLMKLNESVCREKHMLPAVDHVLACTTVFSKLDTNSGFWQIRLAEESHKLITFITPMDRYCFNRLPFGITSAPEHFQRKMSQILEGLKGVVCMMDDILVYGSTQAEHNSHLISVLDKTKASGATLNEDKCHFPKKSIKFLGHIIDGSGICPDPDKVIAIAEMKSPANVTEVR